MSRETNSWLNENTLIGFTATRGNAWHWRQGTANHFEQEVPVKKVRELFSWEPVVIPVTYGWKGKERSTDRVLIVRGDNGDHMGTFSTGYRPHGYQEWLLNKVETILDDSLKIGSAGLLRNGAIAWVSVEVPEAIDVPSVGEKIRPSLLATTSFDGKVATTYKRHLTRIVCDNTLDMGLSEKLAGYQVQKVKHTSGSLGRLDTITTREALGIVFDTASEFAKEIEKLAKLKVTKRQWAQFLDVHVPVPEEEGRGRTMASTKRDKLDSLYTGDARVHPWMGTAWGVLNAVNTYEQHMANIRGAIRQERAMENAIKGKVAETDTKALEDLRLVLSNR